MADSQVPAELGDLRVADGCVDRLGHVHAEGAGQVFAPRRAEDPLAELVGVDVPAQRAHLPLVVAVDGAAGAFHIGDDLGLRLGGGVVDDLDVVGDDLGRHGRDHVGERPDVRGVARLQHLLEDALVGDGAALQQGDDLDTALEGAGDGDVEARGVRKGALELDGQQVVGVVHSVVGVLHAGRALPVLLDDQGVRQPPMKAWPS